MGIEYRASNGETVPIDVWALDANGSGVPGVTWALTIKRVSDGFWWNGSAFQSGFATLTPTAVDATNYPGLYRYSMSSSDTEVAIRATTANASVPLKAMGGAIIWAAAATVSGANTVTLTVEAPASTPQVGVYVTVKNSAETQTLWTGLTDALGQVQLSLDNGSYKVLCQKASVAAWSTYSLTVSGTTSATIIGTLNVITPPGSPSLCAVLLYPTVDAQAGAVSFIALPNQVVASVFVDTTPVVASVVADTVDYYRAELVRNALYRVWAPGRFTMDDSIFTVPDLPNANLADLVEGLREV
jgi:hypothetical protein